MEEYPQVQNILKFVKARVQVLENAGSAPSTSHPKTPAAVIKKPVLRRTGGVSLVASAKPRPTRVDRCPLCSATHHLKDCVKFQAASIDDRYQTVCTHRLCMVCFSSSHMSYRCPSACSICSRRHHALLHRESSVPKPAPPQTSLLSRHQAPTVLLGTAVVHVLDVAGCGQTVRALIDSASQISALTSDCCVRLGLCPSRWTVPVTGLSGQKVPNVQGAVMIHVQPREAQSPSLQVKTWVLPSITSDLPVRQLPSHVRSRCNHLSLADPQFDFPAPIDLLLGADVFSQVWNDKSVPLGKGYPSAYSSVFGWVLIGPIQESPDVSSKSSMVSTMTSIESMMERFWAVEEPEPAPLQFTEEGQCEAKFVSEMYRDVRGRFTLPLPVPTGCSVKSFPGTRQLALNRFLQLERKLMRDQPLYNEYQRFMQEYEDLGHMSRAEDPGEYFIPHHAVRKIRGEGLKLRVVFDASARCHSGVSLNDCLYVGPKLQLDIVDVLIGFRVHRIAFTTDICKMYRQIWVHPKYLGLQHILWRRLPHEQIKEYTLNTVTYGVNSAPYLALRVLRHIADNDCEDAPAVRRALRLQTYMDDICVGAETVEEAKQLQKGLISILARSGLELSKWASNSPELIATIPPEHRAGGPLVFDQSAEIPVLGLQWTPDCDVFTYDMSALKMVPSKRGILSMIARIYDPLGFLAPVILYAKHIMQRLWIAQISWDDPLPSDIEEEWLRFYNAIGWLTEIKVARHIGSSPQSHYLLCGFCDASVKGYAAVVYLRVRSPSQKVSVFLLGTKTKLAPMKDITIPRLELCAAVLLAQWMARLKRVLEAHIQISEVFAWSDSTIVLAWLNNPHTSFKTFVSNRVHQIQKTFPQGCQPLLMVPEVEVTFDRPNLRNRWKLVQQLGQSFWRRWSAEYLNTLQARGRWTDSQVNVKVNDMVVVRDNTAPPLCWRLGRIVELLPGSDGIVRVVKVLTKQGEIVRPVVKLVVLPTE